MADRRRGVWLVAAILPLLLVAVFIIGLRFGDWEIEAGGVVWRAQPGSEAQLPTRLESAAPGCDLRLEELSFDREARPRNVALIIGDGMGIGATSTASYLLHGPAGGLAVEGAPITGLVRTWAGNTVVTGSAASATAMATGMKTVKKAVSWLPGGDRPISLFEAAKQRGLATGLITTSGLVDATPAAFAAHVETRNQYFEILEQMLASRTDLMIGGDYLRYRKASRNKDYVELVNDVESAVAGAYRVIRNAEDLDTARTPLLALFPARPGSRRAYGPPLEISMRRALQLLSNNQSGFLLVIENEDTDELAHNNDLEGVVRGVAELDAALRVALDFAAERGDTLVLVTADHDTGGPGIVTGWYDEGVATVRWASDDHTAQWVPIYAWGPSAHRFGGVLDNTEIGRTVAELLGLEGLPDSRRKPEGVD
jgi:alkaline phosphatase